MASWTRIGRPTIGRNSRAAMRKPAVTGRHWTGPRWRCTCPTPRASIGSGESITSRGSFDEAAARAAKLDFTALRLAITDLRDTFGTRVPRGPSVPRTTGPTGASLGRRPAAAGERDVGRLPPRGGPRRRVRLASAAGTGGIQPAVEIRPVAADRTHAARPPALADRYRLRHGGIPRLAAAKLQVHPGHRTALRLGQFDRRPVACSARRKAHDVLPSRRPAAGHRRRFALGRGSAVVLDARQPRPLADLRARRGSARLAPSHPRRPARRGQLRRLLLAQRTDRFRVDRTAARRSL